MHARSVEEAREALAHATSGVARCDREVAALTRQIRDADPDGPQLATLVQARAEAAGRVEALRARADRAAQALATAERQAADAQRREREEEVRRLDAQARDLGAALDREAAAARERLACLAGQLRSAVARANELEGRPWRHRNASWSVAQPGAELAHAHARLVFLAGREGRACPTCGVVSVMDRGGPAFSCVTCGFTAAT
jgi:chromosome segregation ATPase